MAATEWSERTRLLITIAVVAVVNLAVWGYAFTVRGQWQAKEKTLSVLIAEVKKLQEVAKSKEGLEKDKKALEAENLARRSQLPDESKVLRFMILLSEFQKNYNLIDRSGANPRYGVAVDVAGLTNPQNFSRDIWPVRCQGDFKGLCEFLNKLEEHHEERFVTIENLVITAPNSGMVVTGSKHDISMDLITYRYAAKSE